LGCRRLGNEIIEDYSATNNMTFVYAAHLDGAEMGNITLSYLLGAMFAKEGWREVR
jgi:hypothetical protein